MAKVGVLVCLLVVAMDFVAGIIGVKAEITEKKRNSGSGCKEASQEAFKLGLAAAALQAVAHTVANLLGGCLCICYTEELERSSGSRQFLFACLILSWTVVAVGFPMMIIGMLENSKLRESSCGSRNLDNHFMLIGGVSCFLHGLFSIVLYVPATFSLAHQTNIRRQHEHEHHQPNLIS